MSALQLFLMELLLELDVSMLRAEAEVKSRVLAVLALMQRDIVGLLANAPEMSESGKADKNALLRESNDLIAQYYGKAQAELDLAAVADVQAHGVQSALAKVIDLRPDAPLPAQPELREVIKTARAAASEEAVTAAAEVRLGVALPTENYLRTVASNALIQGAPAKQWWERQSQDTQFKLANEIRIGAAQGETNAQIIKRITGSNVTAKAPADGVGPPGIMPLAKKNAAAVVQTAMAQIAADARRATFQANSDLIRGIEQVSTLDSHTSLTCIAYSGARWDLEYEPMDGNDLPYNGGVPRHFNCRSAEVAVTKTYREMGIPMDEPPDGTRASSNGQIPAKTSFADFLKMKGEDYQNEVLGKGRAELFRQGKMTPRDLVDMRGQPLKLADVRAQFDVREFNQPIGKATIYDSRYPRVKPDVSTPARAAAVKFEEEIRAAKLEHGAFFSADGSMIISKVGERNKLSFYPHELEGTQGSLFTHNHPGGTSFSPKDVMSASELQLNEVRVAAKYWRHTMSAPGGWPTPGVIKSTFNRELLQAYPEVDKMIAARQLSSAFADAEAQHLAWVEAAKKLGLIYVREAS
jgi:hypothetical protein